MQITLYHLKNSRSQRILWLLEELGYDYQVIDSADSGTHDLPNHILPLKFPTVHITDEDSGIYLTESSAICEFLSNRFQSLIPVSVTEIDLANYFFWKNYADASLMQSLVLKQVFKQIVVNTPLPFKPVPWLFKYSFNKLYLNKTIEQQLKRVDEHLKTNTWMCANQFTIADILMWFPLEACMVTMDPPDYPHITFYLAQFRGNHNFNKALESGNWSSQKFRDYWT